MATREDLLWMKSSHSGEGGDCVEVAVSDGRILVRDSKDPDGARLAASPTAWIALLDEQRP
ncbi:DUF397 domain-containing protein [Actinomadura parmotrematis]|uniref:DUF397 domain-containing protein n=1 Tax=Actinomadura parmotrematis TaxID=2864039 RepID=A0ABS7FZM3_9ACTN|nr:DUF397 domain-containing protein [Actinomadura parmotrematis]MBW8485899.1 DUF397 domain-containing protein [Actinomadura parmotrematis]